MALSRIMLQMPPRDRTPEGHVRLLFAATSMLQEIEGRLDGFHVDLGNRRGDPLTTPEALVAELDKRWEGKPAGGVYTATIAVPEGRRIRAHLTLMFGHSGDNDERAPFGTLFKLRWMGRNPPNATVFRRMLTALVNHYRPLWGALGGSFTPSPSVVPGALPSLGWDTFLSRHYGALPAMADLPDALAVTPWGDLGAILRAFPEVLDESKMDHLDALQQLRKQLRQAGVLKAVAELETMPVGPSSGSEQRTPEQRTPEQEVKPTDDDLNQTVDVSHANLAGTALPFSEATEDAVPPSASEPDEDAPAKGGTLDLHFDHFGNSAPQVRDPLSGSTLDMPATEVAPPEHPMMALDHITQYAELHARLSLATEPRAEVYKRFAVLDDADFTKVDTWWRHLLASEPIRTAQFRALYEKYMRELAR